MHIKSAVILCALYFVTVTQSVGLTKKQVVEISALFKDHKNSTNSISRDAIVTLGMKFGMDDMSDFVHDQSVPDARKLQSFLELLAINDKKTDDWMDKSVRSYEVRTILWLFNKKDENGNHDGLLKKKEINEVISVLNLDEEVKNDIVNTFSEDELAVNAAELLEAFLIYKPEGSGLDQNQVKELIHIHDNDKEGDHIKPDKIKELFIKLFIVGEQDIDKMVFPSNPRRKSVLELQELVFVTAEYNKDKSTNVQYSVQFIREALTVFSEHDKNKNGVLGEGELKEITIILFQHNNEDLLLSEFDNNSDGELNIVEFFSVLSKARNPKEKNPEKK